MKNKNKQLTVLVILLISLNMKAQINNNNNNSSVEKSVFGIQIGVLGTWVHNEIKVFDSFALRSEIGVEFVYYDNSLNNDSGIFAVPSIILEPRWYYNLNKRVNKKRRIDGNSGNFLSLKLNYRPDLLLTKLDNNYNFVSDISVVPTWGIRRNIGKHFNYETAIGIGYVKYFGEENVIFGQEDVRVNLHLRIGYRF